MRPQPLIAVNDVERSSRWYQQLLGCTSAHGGANYERLVANDTLILKLHHFAVEDHHGPIGDAADKPYGNGVLLWFEIDDFDAALSRAVAMQAEIILPRHRNPPMATVAPTTTNVGCATPTVIPSSWQAPTIPQPDPFAPLSMCDQYTKEKATQPKCNVAFSPVSLLSFQPPSEPRVPFFCTTVEPRPARANLPQENIATWNIDF